MGQMCSKRSAPRAQPAEDCVRPGKQLYADFEGEGKPARIKNKKRIEEYQACVILFYN